MDSGPCKADGFTSIFGFFALKIKPTQYGEIRWTMSEMLRWQLHPGDPLRLLEWVWEGEPRYHYRKVGAKNNDSRDPLRLDH